MAEVDSFRFDPARLEGWIAVGGKARAGDARWIAPPAASIRRQLAEGHPLWRHVEHRLFAAVDRARCSAMVNPRLTDGEGRPYGQVGWFEATDDDAGRWILDAACAWLRERGCATALGPMNGSTWHAYRFVTRWHDAPPFLLEPNNPERYPALWAAHGWRPLEPLYHSSRQDNAELARTLAPARKAGEEAGYHIEAMDLRDLEAALRRVYELSLEVFAGNAYYSPITWEEFRALYDGVERLLEPELVHWLWDPKGAIVGFGFGVVDRAAAARRMRGGAGAWAKLRWLTAPRPTQTLLKTMGILSAHQGKGLASMLFHAQAERSLAGGYRTSVRALMAASNRSFAAGRSLHRVIRDYALFERPL